MREQFVRNSLYNILYTWSILIQMFNGNSLNKNNTTSNEVILIDQIYSLFSSICQLLQLESNYILDTWEQNDYNIDKTIDYIIKNNFEVIGE